MDQLTPELISELRDIFVLFAPNEDNMRLTTRELGTIMRSLGQCLTEAELQDMITAVDLDGTGSIDFEEFAALMVRRPRDENPEKELIEAFGIFDKDADSAIGLADMRKEMENLGERMTVEEIKEMLQELDQDRDGKVTKADFVQTMVGR
mmetsp:Transcript_27214/g.75835  ORF Transcript_27214/g.75835 Transcript_27214/m.75835 type:complete len:150 (-) Transcript_27214:81-530(-)|eukprot:CAMPEP_0117536812 /NCGR_PEP_ID=MMETSP0784-20121206/41643_1 /TAXON_ID=39447 /ORGANISM="" /LENGTH=149 /DNA_ID=CAMNT_0005333381 /DNA_START=50 /DNA_END=499 /DNA_ORIENTATION=-